MNMHELGMNSAWNYLDCRNKKHETWVLLGQIYCVLSMNMGMDMPKNHELFLPG